MNTANGRPSPRVVPRLAYAPMPLDDEPLDGYLEYLADGMGVPHRTLHRQLGLKATTAYALVRDISAPDAAALTRATDLPAGRWATMTLRRYAHVQLMPPPDKRGHGTGVWARGSGARYCPACLDERGLRWSLSWYLQWSFACHTHERLLLTRCPRCQRPPRSRAAGHPIRPSTSSPLASTPGGCDCATSILASATTCTELDEPAALAPVVAAQKIVHRVIHDDLGTVRAFGRPVSRIEWLNDVAGLTRLLAIHLTSEHIPAAYVDVLGGTQETDDLGDLTVALRHWTPHLDLEKTASPAARLRDVTLSPVASALTATAAIGVVTSPNIETARELLMLLPEGVRAAAASKASNRRISWALAMALDSRPGRSWRGQGPSIRIKTARLQPNGRERPPLDPSKVPARLWSEVLDRHSVRQDSYTKLAASAALLSIGTEPNLQRACQRLGHQHMAGRVKRDMSIVLRLADPQDTDLFDDLLALHEALVAAAVPIDYVRRRRAFTHAVPPAARTARRIARELNLRPTPRLGRFMGWWVFEQLSGSDVLLTQDRLEMHASHRIAYTRQREAWDANPPEPLLKRAERALLVNCLDEPLTWKPTRTSDDAWCAPEAQISRLLDGWARRRCRSSSQAVPTAAGLTLEEIVGFALSRQSLAAERLALKLARFAVVAETGNITRAAARVGLRQSSMTESMRSLERELEITLLDRGTHRIDITDVGRQLHRLISTTPLIGLGTERPPIS